MCTQVFAIALLKSTVSRELQLSLNDSTQNILIQIAEAAVILNYCGPAQT